MSQHMRLRYFIQFLSNESSGESVHMHKLTTAFAAHIHKSTHVDEDSDQNLDI